MTEPTRHSTVRHSTVDATADHAVDHLMDDTILRRGKEFLDTNARLLERRLAGFWFGGGGVDEGRAIFDVLASYRNDDGGLGNALEPDVRTAASQPLAVDFALEVAERVVTTAGADPRLRTAAREFGASLVPYLDSVAQDSGALPIVLPSIRSGPRAAHWGDGNIPAGLNPTAGIVARLRSFGVQAGWLDRAEAYCRDEIDRALAAEHLESHAAANILRFLDDATDRDWAADRLAAVSERICGLGHFHLYPGGQGYGLTPLDLAPAPESPHRALFPEDAIEAHLSALAAAQEADGGWPLSWAPPGPAAELEWRGVVAVNALRRLTAR